MPPFNTDLKGMELRLGRHADAVAARLARFEAERVGARLWAGDHTVWSAEPVPELTDRLGWLPLPQEAAAAAGELGRFARAAAERGLRDAVVLGMGGSSLAPEVFARVFGTAAGHLDVHVLDSTHPGAVLALAGRLDFGRTLFLVSSKSGTTTEPLSFFHYFWHRLAAALPAAEVGSRFAAITDPGTPLEKLARERGFAAVFPAPPEVGGRYSALTPFGMVPAALLGVDVETLAGRARAMAEASGPGVPAAQSPGLALGAALGELALAGRDKLTFVTSPTIAAFPDWLEQLIAESTGKHGKGIVPVAGETLGRPEAYGADRVFVALLLSGAESGLGDRLAALEAAGQPVIRIALGDRYDLGREIFRWEMAVAVAGAVLGINPFDQPDVQLAKELAAKAMKAAGGPADPAPSSPAATTDDLPALRRALADWLADLGPADYLGLQAYLPMTEDTVAALGAFQSELRDRTERAVTLGFGPRFLHSTGQLHKGGPATGRFLQIVDQPAAEVPVPDTAYSFRTLIRAQADGDRQALEQRGRRVLRLDLGGAGAAAGLAVLERAAAGLWL